MQPDTIPSGRMSPGAAEPTPLLATAPTAAQTSVAGLLDLVLDHASYIGRGALLSACSPVERIALAVVYGERAGVPAHTALDRMYLWIEGWRDWRVRLAGYSWEGRTR